MHNLQIYTHFPAVNPLLNKKIPKLHFWKYNRISFNTVFKANKPFLDYTILNHSLRPFISGLEVWFILSNMSAEFQNTAMTGIGNSVIRLQM